MDESQQSTPMFVMEGDNDGGRGQVRQVLLTFTTASKERKTFSLFFS